MNDAVIQVKSHELPIFSRAILLLSNADSLGPSCTLQALGGRSTSGSTSKDAKRRASLGELIANCYGRKIPVIGCQTAKKVNRTPPPPAKLATNKIQDRR